MTNPDPGTALIAANARYLEKHGHEDPDYLRAACSRMWDVANAAQAEARAYHQRYIAASRCEWEKITDAEIMASETLKLHLIRFSCTERYWSDRLRKVLPTNPLGTCELHDIGDGKVEKWRPMFVMHTNERDWTTTPYKMARTVAAIIELGEHWALDRRLIKIEFMCPDLGEIGSAVWIEYEPETQQGRVMTRSSRYADAEQLIYGPVAELLFAAVDHVELLKGQWNV